MTLIQHRPNTMRLLVVIGLLAVLGCDKDERLIKHAQQSIEQQAKQNEQIARQSEAVTQQTQQIAEAAHRMVEADAQARRELVEAQRELNFELQSERTSLDRQHKDLERQRELLAEARQREPIVAAAIQAMTLTLACLLPLLVCAYALRQLGNSQPDDDGLSELLVQELAADEPRLLLGWHQPPPAIEHHPPVAEAGPDHTPEKGDTD